MKNLIIIGARGFGREVYFLAKNSIGFNKEFTVKGFLDDDFNILDKFDGFPPILDSVENYKPLEEDVFICALGDVFEKLKYSSLILDKGGEFISLIHSEAYISPNVKIGAGCIIMSDVRISTNVDIGDFVTIMVNTVIGHDARIDDWVHIAPFVFLGGGSIIKKKSQIHVRSTILSGVLVGKESVTGAGSVVIKNVKDKITVFGNPAKEIGKFN